MELQFSQQAWQEYLWWQKQDKRSVKRINNLIKDIARNGEMSGIGKPEPLKGNLSGWWSRRIDDHNRLVYQIAEENCRVIQCKGHYGDVKK